MKSHTSLMLLSQTMSNTDRIRCVQTAGQMEADWLSPAYKILQYCQDTVCEKISDLCIYSVPAGLLPWDHSLWRAEIRDLPSLWRILYLSPHSHSTLPSRSWGLQFEQWSTTNTSKWAIMMTSFKWMTLTFHFPYLHDTAIENVLMKSHLKSINRYCQVYTFACTWHRILWLHVIHDNLTY